MDERKIRRRVLGVVLIVGLAASCTESSPSATRTAPAPAPSQRPRADTPVAPLELPRVLPSRTLTLPILMYHRIAPFDPGVTLPVMTRRLTVAPADFAAQMRWLKRNGFRTITQRELFDALIGGRKLGGKPVLITFDDGYRNVFANASPVLARLGMHATAYVNTSRISNHDPSFLTWAMLDSLERRGIEIGSHSSTHRDLTSLSDAELWSELRGSRTALERALRHPVQWLAYPFGAYDARVLRFARRVGYVLAVTTRAGTRQAATSPLELRRLSIVDTTGVRGLAAMLGG